MMASAAGPAYLIGYWLLSAVLIVVLVVTHLLMGLRFYHLPS